jgi:enolase
MITIEDVHARQILDSRGNPTVEVRIAEAGPVRGGDELIGAVPAR